MPPAAPPPPPPPKLPSTPSAPLPPPTTISTASATARAAPSASLLDDIRRGTKLNSPALPALDKLSKKHQDGLLSLLSDAMARRRNAIKVEEEAAEAEGGDWGDG